MKRLNLYITDEQSEKLKKLKKVTERTMSYHIRQALDEYLVKQQVQIDSVAVRISKLR